MRLRGFRRVCPARVQPLQGSLPWGSGGAVALAQTAYAWLRRPEAFRRWLARHAIDLGLARDRRHWRAVGQPDFCVAAPAEAGFPRMRRRGEGMFVGRKRRNSGRWRCEQPHVADCEKKRGYIDKRNSWMRSLKTVVTSPPAAFARSMFSKSTSLKTTINLSFRSHRSRIVTLAPVSTSFRQRMIPNMPTPWARK